MSLLFPTTPAAPGTFPPVWMNQPIVYLAVAAVALVIALRFLKRALAPMGALIQTVAAAAVVAFAAVLALAMLVIAAFMTVR